MGKLRQRGGGKVAGAAADLCAGFLGAEGGDQRQQPQTLECSAVLDAQRVAQLLPQHLIAAADAKDRRSLRSQFEDGHLQPALTQPEQVLHRVFGAWQDHQVGRAQLADSFDVAHRHALDALQAVKVGEIGDSRQAHHCDVDGGGLVLAGKPLGKAVLVLQIQIHVRHHADHRLAGDVLNLPQSRLQNRDVAAEFVDDKALDHRLLVLVQQHQCARQRGKDAASVDVSHQQHRRFGQLCHPHVDDVVLLEVDLRRAARSLQHDDVVLLIQLAVSLHDVGDHLPFAPVVFFGGQISQHLAVDDDLGSGVVGRL